jgi:hypothetical protein
MDIKQSFAVKKEHMPRLTTRFEVIMAESFKNSLSWNVTPFNFYKVNLKTQASYDGRRFHMHSTARW